MFRKLCESAADEVTIAIDGVPCKADRHESVAAVLLRQPDPWSRLTAMSGAKRGPYCMMGVCFECLAEVDGVPSVQTCLKLAHDGMCVSRQTHTRRI
jgi:D-hydroxyproline dehydrogenase subunit gamma